MTGDGEHGVKFHDRHIGTVAILCLRALRRVNSKFDASTGERVVANTGSALWVTTWEMDGKQYISIVNGVEPLRTLL